MSLRTRWTFSLADAQTLPLTGDAHPLRREASKWLTWSNGITLAAVALACTAWAAWPHSASEDSAPEAVIVKIFDLKPPPPKVLPPAPKVEAAPTQTQKPAPMSQAAPPKTTPVPEPKPADGAAGKKRAETQVAGLQTATRAVDDALAGLKSSLGKTDSAPRPGAAKRRGGGNLPSARGGAEVASGAEPARAVGGHGSGSSLGGSLLTVEPILSGGGGGAGSASPDASQGGGAPGSWRTNASLLAVVRKYAPGIEYCYDKELEKSPGLRGKLVAALTVAASGEVTEVTIVGDTVGSASLNACVLDQIRAWRFPAIPEGVVTFRTPFVFTPPME